MFGPVFGAAMIFGPTPEGLSEIGWRIGAVGVMMAIWWMAGAAPGAVHLRSDVSEN